MILKILGLSILTLALVACATTSPETASQAASEPVIEETAAELGAVSFEKSVVPATRRPTVTK